MGDLVGWIAASWKRGIPFIQVPTTLLLQVDSSVGGKVAVNHPSGKKLIGAFHQPSLVLADTEMLETLAKRQLISGLAEVVKTALLAGEPLFGQVEGLLDAVGGGEVGEGGWGSCFAGSFESPLILDLYTSATTLRSKHISKIAWEIKDRPQVESRWALAFFPCVEGERNWQRALLAN